MAVRRALPAADGRASRFTQNNPYYGPIRESQELIASESLPGVASLEDVVVQLSATFINLPPERVGGEIENGLQRVARAIGAERATICERDEESADSLVKYAWAEEGIPKFPERPVKNLMPWIAERISSGKPVFIDKTTALPPEASCVSNYMESAGIKSAVIVPFRVFGKVAGGIAFDSFSTYLEWDPATIFRVQFLADIFAEALARKSMLERLHGAYAEIESLKVRLDQENRYLCKEIDLEFSHPTVVGNSPGIRTVLQKSEQVASTDAAVLIFGETGTGKELIARTIHELSSRRARPLVTTNCAALPATLIESELFGREKGAYTGSLAREIGRFELADRSTIFLDEIGELPLEAQSKLLRVLEDGELERLGSARTLHVNVRIIAATNRDLRAMVREGRFREDLYYRLNVFPISIPPLREHPEDIPALVWHVLKDLGKRMGRNIEGVQASTMTHFQKYHWPGNVRELRNVIERNLILHNDPIFRAELPEMESSRRDLQGLQEVEADYVRSVMQACHWRVRGRGGAAEIVGLKPTTLEARMKKMGIYRPNC